VLAEKSGSAFGGCPLKAVIHNQQVNESGVAHISKAVEAQLDAKKHWLQVRSLMEVGSYSTPGIVIADLILSV
jgi:hypothetical protein